ncbi:MAG: hypothetical protein GY759_10100, partial [Chloroflexi bacterium]|nr:hypothetical protein [Chloroflexota bacterium]
STGLQVFRSTGLQIGWWSFSRVVVVPECLSVKTALSRSTGLQVYRFSGLQVYRSTGFPVYRSTGLQVFRSTGLQIGWWSFSRVVVVPECLSVKTALSRSTGLQVFRSTDLQVHRSTGFPVYRYPDWSVVIISWGGRLGQLLG